MAFFEYRIPLDPELTLQGESIAAILRQALHDNPAIVQDDNTRPYVCELKADGSTTLYMSCMLKLLPTIQQQDDAKQKILLGLSQIIRAHKAQNSAELEQLFHRPKEGEGESSLAEGKELGE